MSSNDPDDLAWRSLFYALVILILLVGLGASVRAGQHEGHDMPGMTMPKPKPKSTPRKRVPPKRAPTAPAQPTPTPTDTHNMHDMPGMAQPTPTPATPVTVNEPPPAAPASEQQPAPSPTSSATPSPEMNMQGEHEMHGGHMPAAPQPATSTPTPQPAGHDMPAGHTMPGMSHEGSMTSMSEHDVNELMVMSGTEMAIRVGRSEHNLLPMGQMGSGTAWQPSASPMNMIHKQSGDWLLMFHYNFVGGINHQGGPRGVTKIESANWFMPMAYRRMGKGTLQLRGMFSLEPFTFPPGGSPLLFQTGETYKGQPLIDRQHPHDLFMELSAQYTAPIGEHATWFGYFGYPGEPALGPVAFMHRASASENPSATLAHHLQDSTHISFGVATTGFTYRWFKLEGSLFNGREPDENRYNFEAHPWNSRSARLSFAPNNNWTFQLSHGFLRHPEALEPGDTRRTTASAQYDRQFTRGNLAAAFIWGRNHISRADGDIANLNSYTGEATVNFIDKNYLYTRLELVDKDELLRAEDRALLGITDEHPRFRIGAYTFGYVRDVKDTGKMLFGLGGDVTRYSMPNTLDALYGSNPTSYKFFFRIRPSRMRMAEHSGHASP
ncbi:MAG: hypothetical protein ACJ74W_03210 [Pyrinomonadaceae bacterium]